MDTSVQIPCKISRHSNIVKFFTIKDNNNFLKVITHNPAKFWAGLCVIKSSNLFIKINSFLVLVVIYLKSLQ